MILSERDKLNIENEYKKAEIVLRNRNVSNLLNNDVIFATGSQPIMMLKIKEITHYNNLRDAVSNTDLNMLYVGDSVNEVYFYYKDKFEKNMYRYTYVDQPVTVLMVERYKQATLPS